MTIGGAVRYDVLAQMHRPKSAQALCAEVRRLASMGLTAVDSSVALRIDQATIREMLIASPEESVRACAEVWNARR